jgi:hypothetical protein
VTAACEVDEGGTGGKAAVARLVDSRYTRRDGRRRAAVIRVCGVSLP